MTAGRLVGPDTSPRATEGVHPRREYLHPRLSALNRLFRPPGQPASCDLGRADGARWIGRQQDV